MENRFECAGYMRLQVGLVNTKKSKTNISGISSNMLPAEKTRITEIGKRSNNKLIIAP